MEKNIKLIEESFNTLKPFQSEADIPDIPIVDKDVYGSIIVPNLIRCGAIPKSELLVGKTYIGSCRNSSEAVWNGSVFEYERHKWGTIYTDTINHFQDDDGHDLFVPVKEKNT